MARSFCVKFFKFAYKYLNYIAQCKYQIVIAAYLTVMHEEKATEFELRMTCYYIKKAICLLLASEQVILGSTSLSFVSSNTLNHII